jgi:hypothetical protein
MDCRGIESQSEKDEQIARLERRVRTLEHIIVMSRKTFRSGGDPIEARAWLFRVDIDEDEYPIVDVSR